MHRYTRLPEDVPYTVVPSRTSSVQALDNPALPTMQHLTRTQRPTLEPYPIPHQVVKWSGGSVG